MNTNLEIEIGNNAWISFLRRKKVGRNQKCPCGSGKKFKTCCLKKIKEIKNDTK